MSSVVTQGEIGFRVRSRTGSINSTLKKKNIKENTNNKHKQQMQRVAAVLIGVLYNLE